MAKVVKKLNKKTLTWYQGLFKKTLPGIKEVIGVSSLDDEEVGEWGTRYERR